MQNRLYVLISNKLDPVYGSVQGGHAVAQYLLEHDVDHRNWNNDYLVYLYADIEEWLEILEWKKLNYSCFKEPDLDDACTAIAIESDGKLFKKLQLVA